MLRLHPPISTRPARKARCIAMLESVGISRAAERLKAYPHQVSRAAMRQRVVIAIVALGLPRPHREQTSRTTALDVTIQSQILKLMRKRISETGGCDDPSSPTISRVVSEMVDKIVGGVALLRPRVVETGPAREVIANPSHPYPPAASSIRSPNPRDPKPRLAQRSPARVADIRDLPSGCSFHPRCPAGAGEVRRGRPGARTPTRGALAAACHFPNRRQEIAIIGGERA